MIIFVSIIDTKNKIKMTAEIEKFIEIQNNIDVILKNSPFKMSYIIEKSGSRPSQWQPQGAHCQGRGRNRGPGQPACAPV